MRNKMDRNAFHISTSDISNLEPEYLLVAAVYQKAIQDYIRYPAKYKDEVEEFFIRNIFHLEDDIQNRMIKCLGEVKKQWRV